MKTLSNKDYYEKIIKPNHRPYTRDIGDQRDPSIQVYCSCQFNKKWSEPRDDYLDHVVDLLDKEFNFLKDYNDSDNR